MPRLFNARKSSARPWTRYAMARYSVSMYPRGDSKGLAESRPAGARCASSTPPLCPHQHLPIRPKVIPLHSQRRWETKEASQAPRSARAETRRSVQRGAEVPPRHASRDESLTVAREASGLPPQNPPRGEHSAQPLKRRAQRSDTREDFQDAQAHKHTARQGSRSTSTQRGTEAGA